MKELAIFILLYAFAYSSEYIALAIKRKRELRKALSDERAGLMPLDVLREDDCRSTRKHSKTAAAVLSCSVAFAANPATVEAIKHYVVHILIYSGYVVPSH